MIRAVHFHAVEGRMRIHIAGVKGSPVKAHEVEDRLGRCYGINSVSANTVTGNVLINYDSNRISQWELLGRLREMAYLGDRDYIPQNQGANAADGHQVSRIIAGAALEALLSALIL